MRNEKGQFVKGYGFWSGKKRPGLVTPTAFKAGSSPWNKGLKTIKNCKQCGEEFSTNKGRMTKPNQKFCSLSCSGKYQRGATYSIRIEKTAEYITWRRQVLNRDKFQCVWCGDKENLHVDHILPKSLYPELMFDITNGRVLCFDCHKLTPTYARKVSV